MISTKTLLFVSWILSISICFHVGNSSLLLDIHCEDDEFYDVNTTSGRIYRSNLESLLSVLSSNYASHSNGFYNYSVGSGAATVEGLFLCRGDLTPSGCQDCLAEVSASILKVCTNQTGAFVLYEKCMLRFSNQSIFSRVETRYILYYRADANLVSDTALLKQVLADTLNQTITQAAYDHRVPGMKYSVFEKYYRPFEKIYALAQCTPDLTDQDCKRCLNITMSVLPQCCSGMKGASAISASCNIRYGIGIRFYDNPSPTPAPQSLPQPPLKQTTPNSPPPPPPPSLDGRGISTTTIVLIAILITLVIAVFVVVLLCVRRAKTKKRSTDEDSFSTDTEFLRYNFSQVQDFTNNFAKENMIGQGGFGSVYKGLLPNGQVVAMKRLSKSSSQGVKEFINEISLVAKLQHKNLVRLLGYCLEGEEKILIYEFVTNKSLDYTLFDPEKKTLLDWLKRYTIIGGIARGLLYLHEDSRIKIIHRDLKAGNVLLDQSMNAKIADFGMARLFGIDQSHGSTSNIAGTLGYMAPEYMFQGILSVKSDVFSFGVLIMEIISGKKISNFECSSSDHLLTYAWKNWRDGTPLALMDPTLGDSYDINEVIRCVHIGLLCVAEDAEQRPTMASVVLMLNSYSIPLPDPNPPAFFGQSRTENFQGEIFIVQESDKSSFHLESSKNDASISELYPR